MAQGSYREITDSGIDFDLSRGSSGEPKIESDATDEIDSNDCVSRECVRSSAVGSDGREDEKEPIEIGETRSSGSISKRVYTSYMSAFGSSLIVFSLCSMYIVTQALICAVDYWITFWYYSNTVDRTRAV